MTTKEIAQKLVEYCRKGDYQTCYAELYSPNCVSIEPKGAMVERAEGMEAMAEKGKKWNEQLKEMHGSEISEPVVCGNHFSLGFTLDATYQDGNRRKTEEIAVYEVQDSKVVKEQFFY